ncbi:MAG TPA: MIP/aquaporin family protein [Solirubrobacteraceae bacterium]|nr:MIP/aquaporin family protein [Solirubrobacteraceae bacterium]
MATVSEAGATRALPLRWRKGIVGELWAEFFGTFVLICFGDGVVAMLWALVGSGRSVPPVSKAGAGIFAGSSSLLGSGDWLLITWGWCLAVVFAVYTVGGVTGAHINPAVTLSAAIRKQLPWGKVAPYWIVQVLGAFVGAALVFLVYNNALNHYDQTIHAVKGQISSLPTYATFATFPAPYFHSVLGPLVDQVVGTFFLVLFICAVTDEFNLPVGGNLAPWIIGMIVMAVGISFGANAGYAINPARDFGPRIFAWIAGWGKLAMPGDYGWVNTYFWVPIVGPLIGGALAAFFYDVAIRDILAARKPPEPGVEAEGRTVQREIPPNP